MAVLTVNRLFFSNEFFIQDMYSGLWQINIFRPLLNSNSIWKQWMKSRLVEMPLQIRYCYYYYYYYAFLSHRLTTLDRFIVAVQDSRNARGNKEFFQLLKTEGKSAFEELYVILTCTLCRTGIIELRNQV